MAKFCRVLSLNLVEVRNIINSFEGNGVLVKRANAAVNNFKVRVSGKNPTRLPTSVAVIKKIDGKDWRTYQEDGVLKNVYA